MKKSLFALAAAGAFASGAQAQSSVTVYGALDGGYNATNTTQKSATAGQVDTKAITRGFSGENIVSSRLGVRGSEDLGGGRAAIFNFELGIAQGTGSVVTNSTVTTAGVPLTSAQIQQQTLVRTSQVGISDKALGTLSFGRRLTGIHGVVFGDYGLAGNNMSGYLTGDDQAAGTAASVNMRVHLNATRMSNGIYYESPTISGASIRIDYSNDGTTTAAAGTTGSASNLGISGRYVLGGLTFKAATHDVKTTAGTVASATHVNDAQAAAATISTRINAASIGYSTGPIAAELIYAANEAKQSNAQVSKVNATMAVVQYTIGAAIPFVRYGMGNTEQAAGVNKADTRGYQIGSSYVMSKRTSLYAVYGSQNSKVKTTNVGAEHTRTEIGLGLFHTF